MQQFFEHIFPFEFGIWIWELYLLIFLMYLIYAPCPNSEKLYYSEYKIFFPIIIKIIILYT